MKPTVLLTLLTTAAASPLTAWRLDLTTTDSRTLSLRGTTSDVGKCLTVPLASSLTKFRRAFFDPQASLSSVARFELFSDSSCGRTGLVYTGRRGVHTFNPSTVRSYRVRNL
ncbi:hypothetical protein VTJ04DRAFT_3732 [Mycothermus thermophilus]|uniref:uncharacterized protein n=1 Tax=Humicola insolens TaxID=85995 RepID=UPI003742CABB